MLLTLPLVLRASSRIEVELFLATECPISNRYLPELRRLCAGFRARGVECIAYFPEARLSQQSLDKWSQDWAVDFATRLDPQARQSRRAGVRLTPSAAVWHQGKLVYRGRIDDRYLSLNRSRRQPTRRDLQDTVQALLEGKSLHFVETKAFGCVIESP
jgi:hypothetical protein